MSRGTTNAIRALIVDDEKLARENLRLRLADDARFDVVAECATGRDAIHAIHQMKPDLAFLDVQMPDCDGFEVLDRIEPEIMPVVVFVTAYDEYALRAFRVHALDYLLKPFDDGRFADMVEHMLQRVAEIRSVETSGEATGEPFEPPGATDRGLLERVIVKSKGRVFFVKTADVHRVDAYGDYARLRCGKHSYLVRKTMAELEQRLDPRRFVRIHRSTIVNVERIVELWPARRGDYTVRLDNGEEIKLTRSHRARLEALLGDRL